MKNLILTIAIISISLNSFASDPPVKNYYAASPKLHFGILTGYNNGYGLNVQFQISDFAQGFPLSVRLGGGMSFLNPGSALQARAIFINNNTNGTPEEKGQFFDARIDFLYDLTKSEYLKFYAGVHFSSFKGNFVYVGGNEDFDVLTKSWGVGAGFDGNFPMTNKIDFVVSLGSGYYFPNTLQGHDTYYSPNDENVNPREDYTYKDADNAINQPKIELRAMIGLNFRL
jgi:hypothetical protein